MYTKSLPLRSGEIATTLTIISLVLMLIGTAIGARSPKPQTTRSSA